MKKILPKGFTLIELIIVVAIIGILAAAAFVALDPAKRIGNSNNAQRWADVTAIADAFNTYVVDNTGNNPTTSSCFTDNIACMIAVYEGTSSSSSNCAGSTTLKGTIWLDPLLTNGYIGEIPRDPADTGTSAATTTGYYLAKDSTGALTIGACNTYNSAIIKVVR